MVSTDIPPDIGRRSEPQTGPLRPTTMHTTTSSSERLLRAALPLLGAALLLTACGEATVETSGDAPVAADPPATGAPSAGSGSADDLVIRVEQVGGFSTPAMLAGRLPLVSVYADGRVITQGAQIAIFPAPALPSIQVHRIDQEGVAQLVDLATTSGVGSGADLGRPAVTDLLSTRVTVVTADGPQTLEAYALQEESLETAATDAGGLTPEQVEARKQVRTLLAALQDPASVLDAGTVTDEGQYEPTAVAAIADAWVDPGAGAELEQPQVQWPEPDLPGEPLGESIPTGCVTTEGAAAQQVLQAAEDANAATPWVSGAEQWTVALRPLLPDESGCADLMD